MNFNEYQELASRTANPHENAILNYALGLAGESGEVCDIIKKTFFHGHNSNVEEVIKELGDILWYVSNMADLLNIELDEVAEINIEKLKRRYPDGFSEEASINRKE